MKCIPRPFDHLEIHSALNDYPLYSHILFLGNEETEIFIKILVCYGFSLATLREKILFSFLPNDALEKHSLPFERVGEKRLRDEFLHDEDHTYLLIPRFSSSCPRFFSLFFQKGIRFQAPSILDRIDS